MRVRDEGRQRIYALDARGLRTVHGWVGGFERFWTEPFERLDEHVQRLQQEQEER